MNKKTIGNKICVSVIIFILIAAIGVMLFLIATKNKKWTVCLQHGGRVPTLLEAVENGTAVRG